MVELGHDPAGPDQTQATLSALQVNRLGPGCTPFFLWDRDTIPSSLPQATLELGHALAPCMTRLGLGHTTSLPSYGVGPHPLPYSWPVWGQAMTPSTYRSRPHPTTERTQSGLGHSLSQLQGQVGAGQSPLPPYSWFRNRLVPFRLCTTRWGITGSSLWKDQTLLIQPTCQKCWASLF